MRSDQWKTPKEYRAVKRKRARVILIATVVLLFVALPQMFSAHAGSKKKAAAGLVFLVNTTDDHNDLSCDSQDCTLAEAINASNNSPTADTIQFSVTGTINLMAALADLTDSVTIQGPGADQLTLIDSSTAAFRIFNITTTGTAVISGLTLNRGSALSSPGGLGGGILNSSTGTVKVNDCIFTFNFAKFGGGIANSSTGTVDVDNCIMADNAANMGGGCIYNDGGTVSVTNSTFSKGGASFEGGGILNANGVVNVTNCTFSEINAGQSGGSIANLNPTGIVNITNTTMKDNRAVQSGGGVYAFSGTINITNSTINNNRSSSVGGGITNGGTVTITNSTISGNTSITLGGGIYVLRTGTTNISNSTINGNSTNGNGGGIAIEDNSPDPITGVAKVKSTIIAANSANIGNDVHGPFTSQGFNLISRTDYSTGFTQPTDLTGVDGTPFNPMLDPNGLQDNGGPTKTIALLCGSPAIDKGTANGLTTDQRDTGFPRVIDDSFIPNASGGDGVDIGAFELTVCNHPPVAQCRNIQISAGSNCPASITAAQIDNGSFDPDPGDTIVSRTLDTSGPFGLGTHTVVLTVIDTHAAMSSCTATVTVVDTTPPTITCPANIIIQTTNAGNTSVVVNYPLPTASDNCGAVTVVCSPPSGASFPLGITTVTCTATDGAGNTASCSFTVTVFDVCVQDDTSRDTLLFNSHTGDYLYRRCGAGGFSLSGRGSVRVQGSLFILDHSASDRRLSARIDNSQKKGTTSVQVLPSGTTFAITDRNTDNNTCACL
jgi:CSLREA domain-containing protein